MKSNQRYRYCFDANENYILQLCENWGSPTWSAIVLKTKGFVYWPIGFIGNWNIEAQRMKQMSGQEAE